jgi:hypothetical protein
MDLSLPERRERTFFFVMALVLAATVVAGFGTWALRGNIQFPVPLYVHLHGLVFLTWIGLFITQTFLIRADNMVRHRAVGRFAVVWALVMVTVGLYTAFHAVMYGRVPPVFTTPIFLALSFMELVTFVILLGTAIALRKQTAWHRRLMLGATVAVLSPAWGRILILLGQRGGPILMVALLSYIVAGMVADMVIRGKIHPAYFVVVLAIVVENLGIPVLAGTAPVVALAHSLAPH